MATDFETNAYEATAAIELMRTWIDNAKADGRREMRDIIAAMVSTALVRDPTLQVLLTAIEELPITKEEITAAEAEDDTGPI